jgi:hypothetical protein
MPGRHDAQPGGNVVADVENDACPAIVLDERPGTPATGGNCRLISQGFISKACPITKVRELQNAGSNDDGSNLRVADLFHNSRGEIMIAP